MMNNKRYPLLEAMGLALLLKSVCPLSHLIFHHHHRPKKINHREDHRLSFKNHHHNGAPHLKELCFKIDLLTTFQGRRFFVDHL